MTIYGGFMRKKHFSTQEIARASIGTAIITICSWLCIPTAVPFTMQSFGVILISMIFGRKCTLSSLLIYCLLGIIGLPVFAGFKSGASVIAGPTGGYIIGLFIIPTIIGSFFTGKSEKFCFFSAIAGLFLMYLTGTLWYAFVYAKGSDGILPALSMCVFPFVIPDVIKCILAFVCAKKIRKKFN